MRCVNHHLLTIPLLLFFASACDRVAQNEHLSANERNAVVQEIQQVLREYRETALRQDLAPAEATRIFMGFYSKDLVIAGDGKMTGGYDDWGKQLYGFIEGREKMLSWEWRDVRISVLSRTAASAIYEFEHTESLKKGGTFGVKGTWTYVFTKEDGRWKIVQSNGTHVPL